MSTRRIVAASLVLAGVALVPAVAAFANGNEPTAATPAAASKTAPAAAAQPKAARAGVAYGSVRPANYVTVKPAPAYDRPALSGNEAGELHQGTELESTGRTATAEGRAWMEIKVPGRTTGWVLTGAVRKM
ncbi:MAG: hypothetical protein JWN87_2565 [Frankiales bacterium]|nr:hypothetical protein [Frankiales bacterium]